MNAQFKKGVLELVVLESVRKKDMYGYELVEEVSKVIDVNEGTIYPLLLRLEKNQFIQATFRESEVGPRRKYYSITQGGKKEFKRFLESYMELSVAVSRLLDDVKGDLINE